MFVENGLTSILSLRLICKFWAINVKVFLEAAQMYVSNNNCESVEKK